MDAMTHERLEAAWADDMQRDRAAEVRARSLLATLHAHMSKVQSELLELGYAHHLGLVSLEYHQERLQRPDPNGTLGDLWDLRVSGDPWAVGLLHKISQVIRWRPLLDQGLAVRALEQQISAARRAERPDVRTWDDDEPFRGVAL